MSIKLLVQPRKTYTWQQFKNLATPFSIALDGVVKDRTRRDPSIPIANFDHHHRVDRCATRSTSDQVALEINLGLFHTFQKGGIPEATVWVNDPDEDTCLAYWLLQNHERVIDNAEPAINRLVNMEDRLDSTAGGYPFGDGQMRRTMAWIFEPYNEARFNGLLKKMDAKGMETIIEAVGSRISRYSIGASEQIALEGQYDRIGGGKNWAMVKETGPAARLAMYSDGIEAFVALVSEKDGFYTYSVGRRSEWVNFPLLDIFKAASNRDKEKGLDISDSNDWGPQESSAIIGGSPRVTGTKLSPVDFSALINEELESTAKV